MRDSSASRTGAYAKVSSSVAEVMNASAPGRCCNRTEALSRKKTKSSRRLVPLGSESCGGIHAQAVAHAALLRRRGEVPLYGGFPSHSSKAPSSGNSAASASPTITFARGTRSRHICADASLSSRPINSAPGQRAAATLKNAPAPHAGSMMRNRPSRGTKGATASTTRSTSARGVKNAPRSLRSAALRCDASASSSNASFIVW